MSLPIMSANVMCLMAVFGGLAFAKFCLFFYKENTNVWPIRIASFIWNVSHFIFGGNDKKLTHREQFLICWIQGFFLFLFIGMLINACQHKAC